MSPSPPSPAPPAAGAPGPAVLLRSRRFRLLYLAAWGTMVALYMTRYLLAPSSGVPGLPRWSLPLQALITCGAEALLCLAVWRVAWRWPLTGARWPRHLAVTVAACAGLAWLRGFAVQPLYGAIQGALVLAPPLRVVVTFVPGSLLLSTGYYCVGVALDHFHRFRERERAAARLEAQVAEAELETLKAELRPGFLFDTFRLVSGLMHRDVPTADRTLAQLSTLLRMTLNGARAREVPLHHELEFARTYLDIEQARHGAGLRVAWDVGPGVETARVPPRVLHALVEAAVRRGVEPRGRGTVEVSAARDGGWLELRASHDGAPPDDDGVTAGLRALLPSSPDVALRVEPRPGGGATLSLRLPFRAGEPLGSGEVALAAAGGW